VTHNEVRYAVTSLVEGEIGERGERGAVDGCGWMQDAGRRTQGYETMDNVGI
jgi:hypothetical protein